MGRAVSQNSVGREPDDWLGPLFGQAWSQKPDALLSDRVKALASTGLLNPQRLRPAEIQALAAAVMAYVVEQES